jgi:outer membrane translocation and assembly module TamA
MKTAKKIGISGGMLAAVQGAEASLARQEAKDLEDGLPDGHPLKAEAERQKALLGDLSGLPAGHPLLRAMQEAKDRYEQQQEQRTVEQNKTAEVRKAQKVDVEKARMAARRKEDEQAEQHVGAAKQVDVGINGTLNEIRKLYKTMSDCEQILNNDPYSKVKVGRLKRILYATERGLGECRIAKVRAS